MRSYLSITRVLRYETEYTSIEIFLNNRDVLKTGSA